MSILNISKIVQLTENPNQYTYTRVKNLLLGFRGKSTKKEIQTIRRIIQRELQEADATLAKLEDE